ncbi:PAS domain-containing protein [Sediminicoccus sp. KRV36]|uniref:PAS domain-containing protein n=1 Tax=Sediminicoccus sp. KRV36 TaxID=3133721 RepID=UPI0020109816|nr:PAS domain-containing protein [Sediminicoccus rosea]UPY38801.1 PAS domain-containing protein [Sediminicoccus rosea]
MAWLQRKLDALPLAVWAFIGLIIALVPAAIVQVVLEREARLERTQQLGEQAMRFVRLVGQQQTSVIEAARQVMTSMAAHDAVRALRPSAECDAFLARIIAANPRYLDASVFDQAGQSVCLAHPAAEAINVADRPYFQRALAENNFQVGGYAIGRSTGQRSLHFAAPLRDDAGHALGVLQVALSIDWLVAELQAAPLPAGSSATIADRDGVILARSADPDRFVGQAMPPFAMALLRATGPGILDAPALDGIRRIAAYLPLGHEPLGLFVSVGLDASASLAADLYADRRAALMIVGSLLLTFVLAILGFHAAVERPVHRLLDTVRSWEAQDWLARVGHITGGREFHKLGEAFDTMAESVASREAARLQAQTRMQAVVAVAPQIVLTADRQGQVDWTNEYWRQITGLDMAESCGDGWLAAVHPEDREGAALAWREALASLHDGTTPPFSREMRICQAAKEEWRWFLFTGAPIRAASGEPIAWTAVGLDYHERRQAEADREESSARLRATYESAPAGLCLMDRELRFVAINDMLAETNGHPAAAHIGRTIWSMAPQLAARMAPAMQQVLETGQPVQALELSGLVQGEERFWLCSYFPVGGASGSITGVSGAIIDITTRKRIEASERMLSREVDHRAQNVLSVVRGLIRLSAAEAEDDVPALIAVLEGRIAALSRVHNVLARERWVSAEMEQIIVQELASLQGQVSLEGPSLRLTAEAAQPFAMVLHELVANSVKYGALSRPGGKLALRWRISGQEVLLDWIEQGGPEIQGVPARVGLGSLLIDANMGAQLAGRLERHWLPEGLHCVLIIGGVAFAGGVPMERAEGQAGLSGRRVLIADDQPDRSAAMAAALRQAGCELVGPAASLDAALAVLEAAGTVDAALLPATLQGVSVQLLRQALARRAVVTLHLASRGDLSIAPAPLDALPEPFTPSGLSQALTAALDRHRRQAATPAAE